MVRPWAGVWRLGEDPDLRVLRFPSGRRERNVVRNVAAVGNASGFVEPLEATSLHLIIEQVHTLALGLIDTNHRLTPQLRNALNQLFVGLWDDVRDFLALHYKYNFHSTAGCTRRSGPGRSPRCTRRPIALRFVGRGSRSPSTRR